MTSCTIVFLVAGDTNDWYTIWGPGIIVDQSFLETELYRTKGLFPFPTSIWKFIHSLVDMAGDVETPADEDEVVLCSRVCGC
jgi:hypothetical protein